MRLFHDTIEALSTAQGSKRDAFTVVDETVGWARLLRVQGKVRELADLASEDPLQGAADRYLTLRKFAPDLLAILSFRQARRCRWRDQRSLWARSRFQLLHPPFRSAWPLQHQGDVGDKPRGAVRP